MSLILDEFTYLYPEAPNLISIDQPLFEKLSLSRKWIAEKKYNDNRLIMHCLPVKSGYEFQLWNRHGVLFDYSPIDSLCTAFEKMQGKLEGYCVFDGGLRHNKTKGVRDKIVLWDVLVWKGEVLLTWPFLNRTLLFEVMDVYSEDSPLSCTGWFEEDFDTVFKAVTIDPEIEGLVLKNTQGKLALSRVKAQKSNWMYKVRKPSGRYKL